MIGSSLGPYKILEKIGAGGMGEVFLAEDTRLNRKVAIKVLPAEFAADRERLARFEQEAKAAAALNHPHIAVVHDIGFEEGAGVAEAKTDPNMAVSAVPWVSDESRTSDANNTFDGEAMLGVFSDVVDQQAELALARDELATSKVYVENVLRSMADSLFVIDANLTIGTVNPSLLELLGYGEDELIGQSPGLIFGEEFAQGSIMENLLLQGSVSGIESSFLTQDGRLIPISVSGSMMQDEQGQFQGLVCVAQDITERKRMEEERLQLHEQLLDTSRKLGMAEVASDVLHNVGNVLNSINVSIGIIGDLTKRSMVGDVGRISQLFHQHREDLGNYFSTNPKGKQIPAYLEKLSGQLMEEQQVAIAELDRLRENAQHVQQCVAAQQGIAQLSGITGPMPGLWVGGKPQS